MSQLARALCGVAVAMTGVAAVAYQPNDTPGPQPSAVIEYDERLERVVMISTQPAPGAARAIVWSWDGQRWAALDQPGPPPRSLAAAAYDSARELLVIFGGRVGAEGFTRGDTWTWDGTSWRDAPGAGIGVRNHHAMAYDARRSRTVMYGGVTTPPDLTARQQLGQRDTWTWPSDTWEWDGEQWRRASVDGPGGRSGTALAYDSQQVVLFGGVGHDRAYPAGTWAWDGTSWREVAPEGPPLRASHAMAYDSARGVVVMYGGGYSDGTRTERFQDMWQWDGTRWTEMTPRGVTPGIRIGHAMAYDRARQRVVLFGGFGADGPMSDTWEWDGVRWTRP